MGAWMNRCEKLYHMIKFSRRCLSCDDDSDWLPAASGDVAPFGRSCCHLR